MKADKEKNTGSDMKNNTLTNSHVLFEESIEVSFLSRIEEVIDTWSISGYMSTEEAWEKLEKSLFEKKSNRDLL
ncbi:hypothetical protein GCM10023331_14100 [Algivirga pacifica]|uniref:CopG family transcriptional regulator n=2 Tax=Algivirga pacifica TaxID=1162670 RepID=A0ABP9D672_9BACT